MATAINAILEAAAAASSSSSSSASASASTTTCSSSRHRKSPLLILLACVLVVLNVDHNTSSFRVLRGVLVNDNNNELKLLNDSDSQSALHHLRDEQNHVSACVMVKDGNHELIEWLAFHFYTLPLRRLIVFLDLKSKTTPEPILQRWHGKINYTLWNEQDVFPTKPLHRKNPGGEYLTRQQVFHGKCMRTLYEEGHRYVQLFDPDEYMTINEKVYNDTHPMYNLGLSVDNEDEKYNHGIDVPTPGEPGSTLKFIQRAIAHVQKYGVRNNKFLQWFDTPCIGFHRKQFGTYNEDDQSGEDVPGDFPFNTGDRHQLKPSDLVTYRSRYWGDYNHYTGGIIIGKAMIDFARINKSEIPERPNVHMPLADKWICSTEQAWGLEKYMPLVMNHYAATLEQAMFRADSRGGVQGRIARHESERQFHKYHEDNSHILEWLPGFVNSIGKQEALRLLHNAGKPYEAAAGAYLDPSQEPTKEETASQTQAILQNYTRAQQAQQQSESQQVADAHKDAAAMPPRMSTMKALSRVGRAAAVPQPKQHKQQQPSIRRSRGSLQRRDLRQPI